jgi:hypothetical protein
VDYLDDAKRVLSAFDAQIYNEVLKLFGGSRLCAAKCGDDLSLNTRYFIDDVIGTSTDDAEASSSSCDWVPVIFFDFSH